MSFDFESIMIMFESLDDNKVLKMEYTNGQYVLINSDFKLTLCSHCKHHIIVKGFERVLGKDASFIKYIDLDEVRTVTIMDNNVLDDVRGSFSDWFRHH